MDRCDVLVVGGGPSGSSLAWGLRGQGLDVCVMDRKSFPRDKTCAGWITPQILEELAVDPEIYGKERVLQPIHGFKVRRIGDREAVARFDRTVSYGIRRCEFDTYLLERCEARLRTGEAAKRIEREGGRWVVNGEIEAPLLVGADGHFGPVARRLSRTGSAGEPVVAAKEVEYELSDAELEGCPVAPDLPELFFTEDLKGYGWIFRKGHWLNVGLGRQDKSRLSEHLERFLEFLRAEGRLPERVSPDFKGHAYLLYDQAPRRLVDEGVLLVGDAAGLAYPRSGEGIRPGVESGLLAARTILEAKGDYAAASLAPYERAMTERFGERETFPKGVTDVLPAGLARRISGFLLGTPWFARRYVVERWFLHAHVPPLAPQG